MSSWFEFTLAVLAIWRATHLLACEDGPFDIVVRVRARLGDGLLGSVMDCFNCLSLWLAAPVALFFCHRIATWLLIWLALSGAACVLQGLIENNTQANESSHGGKHVLRQ
jgi:hypothetical protein